MALGDVGGAARQSVELQMMVALTKEVKEIRRITSVYELLLWARIYASTYRIHFIDSCE